MTIRDKANRVVKGKEKTKLLITMNETKVYEGNEL